MDCGLCHNISCVVLSCDIATLCEVDVYALDKAWIVHVAMCGATANSGEEEVQTTKIVLDAAVLSTIDTADASALAAVADAIEAQVAASQGEAAYVIVTKVLVQAVAMAVNGFSEMSKNDQKIVVKVVCDGVCDGRSTCVCVRLVADDVLRSRGQCL